MRKQYPLVSVITVNHNGKHLLKDCFDSLLAVEYPKKRMEIIMVDNCSGDGSPEYVKKNYRAVRVIKNDINNYCKANNLAIRKSGGEYVVLLNNDTKVDKNWLIELVRVMNIDKKAGIAGSKVIFQDGRLQSVGHAEFPNFYWGDRGILEPDSGQYDSVKQVPSVSNCSALYRRGALDEVGLLDEDFNMYMEDVDMAIRMKAKKWEILYAPDSVVFHRLHGSNQNPDDQRFHIQKNRLFILIKHFPEKLPDMFFGNGEILKLGPARFHNLLAAVFNKLVAIYGPKKAAVLFAGISAGIKKIEDYGKHCLYIETEQKISGFQNQITAKDEQINSHMQAIAAKDRQIQDLTQNAALKDQEMANLNQQRTAKDEQINSLNRQLYVKDRQIASNQQIIFEKGRQLNGLIQEMAAKDKQISDFTGELLKKEEQVKIQREAIFTSQQQIAHLNGQVSIRDAQLNQKNGEINALTGKARLLDAAIAQKQQEITNIYNSDTYKFIVRPIVWPVFSFIKKLKSPFDKLFYKIFNYINHNLVKKDITIAQLSANSINAKYGHQNEYLIKLINRNFSHNKIRLAIDIWPYENRSHPDRHFAYFSVEILLKPFDKAIVKLVYDWGKGIVFIINDNKEENILNFWRGSMLSSELYYFKVSVNNQQGKIIDCKHIVQKLIK